MRSSEPNGRIEAERAPIATPRRNGLSCAPRAGSLADFWSHRSDGESSIRGCQGVRVFGRSEHPGGLSTLGKTIPGHLRQFYQQLFAFVRTEPLGLELLQRQTTILHLGHGDPRGTFMCGMYDYEEDNQTRRKEVLDENCKVMRRWYDCTHLSSEENA